MAVTIKLYDSFIDKRARGIINMGSVTVKCMLVTSGYTFNQAHDFRDDITNEVTGTGYIAGGQSVAVSFTTDEAGHKTTTTLAQAIWDATGWALTARQAIYYVARGGASSADELIGCVTSDTDITASNGLWAAAAQAINDTNQNAS